MKKMLAIADTKLLAATANRGIEHLSLEEALARAKESNRDLCFHANVIMCKSVGTVGGLMTKLVCGAHTVGNKVCRKAVRPGCECSLGHSFDLQMKPNPIRYQFLVLLQDAGAKGEHAFRVAAVLFDKVMKGLCHGVPATQMRSLPINDRQVFIKSLCDPVNVYDMVATAKSTGHLRVHMLTADDIDYTKISSVSMV